MNNDPRIEILGSNALVVRSDSVPQLAPLLEDTRPTDKPNELLVRWTLDNCVRLSLAGFDPPSPFRHSYAWTGVKPYAHQVRTAEFVTVHMRCGIWNEQGTGKTISVSAAADYLMRRGKVRRVLILCPLSVMYSAWMNDLAVVLPHRTVAVVKGEYDRREAILRSDAEIVVMNHDAISSMSKVVAACAFDMIVIDEANAFKNSNTKRYRALAPTITPHTRVVLMTGTPASQSPEDAFGLSRLLGNPACPKYITTWKNSVMYQPYGRTAPHIWRAKIDAPGKVEEILRPSIRFTKAQCLDLPDRVYIDRPGPLSAEQQKMYAELKKEMLIKLDSGETIMAAHKAAMLSKLIQIATGVVYAEGKQPVLLDYSPRYEVLREIMEGTQNKIIVFAPFRPILHELCSRLTKDGVDSAVIDGGVSGGDRGSLIFRFQNTDTLRCLLLQPAAAAHGITLTRADTVVWWGPTSSVELYKQANDRPHRIGQTNKCTVYHLTGSVAETKVYATLRGNISVNDNITSLFSDIARS